MTRSQAIANIKAHAAAGDPKVCTRVLIGARNSKASRSKCEASGHRLVGRDFYSVSEKNGQTVCDYCGKAVKISVRNGNEYIPTHSTPKESA